MSREEVVEMFPKALGVYRWDDTDGHKKLKETVRDKMKTKEIDGSPVSKDIFHFWNKSGENFLDEDVPIIKDFEKFLSDNQSYGFDSVKIEECQEHISNIKKLFLEGK